jgi:5S rRNA maturation endonuclease (ribonuclease M5)/uncharacterized ParB-like nuclease family protein
MAGDNINGTRTAFERVLDALEDRGFDYRGEEPRVNAQCPAHEDDSPSLVITKTEGQTLLWCHTGCETAEVAKALGMKMSDLFDNRKGIDYHYADGRVVHRTFDNTRGKKKIWQDGNKGGDALYRLDKIINAKMVWVCEGEKDVHAVESQGEVATCNPQGADSWSKIDPTPLYGKSILVIVHKDDAGLKWAQQVKASLEGHVESIDFVQAETGNDAADHIAAGHDLEDLVELDLSEVQVERSDWWPLDLTSVLDGTFQPPEPTVGARLDQAGLFYAAKSHTVVAETEAGKTWFALAAVQHEITMGSHVVYIDFEDDAGSVAGRLLTLGMKPAEVGKYFHYLRPDGALSSESREDLEELLRTYRPSLAVVDGITEAMTMHDLDPLSNTDVAIFNGLIIKILTDGGAAAVALDHVVKDREGQAGRYALGGIHKLNAVSGAGFKLINRDPFGVGITGRSTIRIAKDRPGQLRANALPGEGGASGMFWYGDLVLESHGAGEATVSIEPPLPESRSDRAERYMFAIVDALEKHGQFRNKTTLYNLVEGNQAQLRTALARLQADGYVPESQPFRLLRSYPDVEESSEKLHVNEIRVSGGDAA